MVQVHLRGTFAPMRHAAAHWRERFKSGADVDARIDPAELGAVIPGRVEKAAANALQNGGIPGRDG